MAQWPIILNRSNFRCTNDFLKVHIHLVHSSIFAMDYLHHNENVYYTSFSLLDDKSKCNQLYCTHYSYLYAHRSQKYYRLFASTQLYVLYVDINTLPWIKSSTRNRFGWYFFDTMSLWIQCKEWKCFKANWQIANKLNKKVRKLGHEDWYTIFT